MTREEELEIRRFCELAEACYTRGRYTFTDFLGLLEYDLFLTAARDFSYVPYTVFGGAAGCERVMVRFGDADSLGYPEEDFPIVCLRIFPAAPKFAEELSHRDVLGALMHLGVRRECLGDIILQEGSAYLFCEEKIAPYLCENLQRIRHTAVRVEVCDTPPAASQTLTAETVHIASPRADGVIAHAYNLSRADSAALFSSRRVFLNGRVCENLSAELKEGDILTVRGFGRFRFGGETGVSRKGKIIARIEKYV